MDFPELTGENFRSVVGVEGIVLVLCRAVNCGACRSMEPAWERTARRFPRHTFARLDVLEQEDLASFFEIGHTPTLMLYRGGLLLLRKAAVYDEEELVDLVGQAESLDMDRVRADLAAESDETED